jgi:hypothetical protein
MDPTFDKEKFLAATSVQEAMRLVEGVRKERDVPITSATLEGQPAMAMFAVAEDAEILVVGSRRRGEFVNVLLGSVRQHVVTDAHCPPWSSYQFPNAAHPSIRPGAGLRDWFTSPLVDTSQDLLTRHLVGTWIGNHDRHAVRSMPFDEGEAVARRCADTRRFPPQHILATA